MQVPDSSALDIPDPSVTQTIEFRFKTPKGYGNIMQKGQALDAGGQIKIENQVWSSPVRGRAGTTGTSGQG